MLIKKILFPILFLIVLSSLVFAEYTDFEQVNCNTGTGEYVGSCNAFEDMNTQTLNNTDVGDVSESDDPRDFGGWTSGEDVHLSLIHI